MGLAWRYLERLTRRAHRGSATPPEAAAAEEMAGWLSGMGYSVRLERFGAPRDTLYLGPSVVMLLFLGAAALGNVYPWAGLLLCAAGLVPLVGEMLGSSRINFDLILPTYPSQNVVAEGGSPDEARRTLVISAHIDTQRASLLFHPSFVRYLQAYFYLLYAGLFAVPVLLAVRWAAPGMAWTGWALWAACGVLAASTAFLLLCRLTGRHTNGANDNGTGAALTLALAERFAQAPPPSVRLVFALTGAEEVGTRGMQQLLRRWKPDPAATWFINLDNLGSGTLHYLTGEGMLAYRKYGPDLVGLAERMAREYPGRVRPRGNLLLPTDGLVPASAGYQAISFLAFARDGSLPNYHWYTDTLERVDPELVAFVEEFLVEYVEALVADRVPATAGNIGR